MPVKTDSDFKQFFWDLVAEEKEKRVKASQGLLQVLQTKTGAEKEEYTAYTIERLVKGLGSNRESARHGFAVALCEHLSLHKTNIEQFLELVDKHLMVRTIVSNCTFEVISC